MTQQRQLKAVFDGFSMPFTYLYNDSQRELWELEFHEDASEVSTAIGNAVDIMLLIGSMAAESPAILVEVTEVNQDN